MKDSVATLQESVRLELERSTDDPHAIAVSLPDFFRTGALGPVHIGMSRQELRDTLGNPDDWSYVETRKDIPPRIYKYGAVEFHFGDDDRLWLIYSDSFDVLHGGTAIRFDPWIMHRAMALLDVQHQLALHAIDYQLVECPHGDNTTVLRVGAGVHLLFIERGDVVDTDDLVSLHGPIGLYGLSFGLNLP